MPKRSTLNAERSSSRHLLTAGFGTQGYDQGIFSGFSGDTMLVAIQVLSGLLTIVVMIYYGNKTIVAMRQSPRTSETDHDAQDLEHRDLSIDESQQPGSEYSSSAGTVDHTSSATTTHADLPGQIYQFVIQLRTTASSFVQAMMSQTHGQARRQSAEGFEMASLASPQ
ncbi:hypothetical protein Q7P37_004412 [Cladosporium fusiforme]